MPPQDGNEDQRRCEHDQAVGRRRNRGETAAENHVFDEARRVTRLGQKTDLDLGAAVEVDQRNEFDRITETLGLNAREGL